MPEQSDYGDIRVVLRGDRVGVVTFNRPDRLNAFSVQTFADLECALRWLGSHADCGAIVITGAGRACSTGMDLQDPLDSAVGEPIQIAYAGLRRAVASPIPLLAPVMATTVPSMPLISILPCGTCRLVYPGTPQPARLA